jgi:F-type H+-transporting ATPase subunit gamma
MPISQRETRQRLSSVKNIQKITGAMQMVAAARLRRAEQRIQGLRPYAEAIRRMTREASEAAGSVPTLPILVERETIGTVGLLLVAGDRGLAGAFNSQIVRAGVASGKEHGGDGRQTKFYASGRRVASSLTFRGLDPVESFIGFSDRPSYADARRIAERLMAAYVDGDVDRVDIFYNGYESPISQVVRRETLLPLQQASIMGGDDEAEETDAEPRSRAMVEYEPDPEKILARLVPDYVEISVYRALLESTASEHGARMTAMRNASDNAGALIDDLTLQMNRARQAEITQEIMEVVAGAEGLG